MPGLISASAWVPRGYAAEFPVKYELEEAEMERIASMARLQLDDAKADLDEAQNAAASVKDKVKDEEEIDEDLKEYDLEHYDDDEDEDADGTGQSMGMFGNIKSLAYYEPGEKDPYVTLDKDEEAEAEEREATQILPTDNLILATRTEDEVSYLEVYVYDDTADARAAEDEDTRAERLYVHHDIMLPSFPLCVEWLDYKVGKARTEGSPDEAGNFAAIGTFEPQIEIWNLDVEDAVYPDLILGAPDEAGPTAAGTGKKKRKKNKVNDKYHVDAVLSLSHNKLHSNLLASGSADETVKVWDLNTGTCAKSFSDLHCGKVSAVAWNPVEGTVLLTGGYDKQAVVSDLRAKGTAGRRRWDVGADVEGVQWAADGLSFYVSTEAGQIVKCDAREEGKILWRLQAHDSEITSFDVSTHVPGLMVTGSMDKTVKLWNVSTDKPSMILSRDLDVGKVFTVGFGPDKEVCSSLVVGGSAGQLRVWDTMTNRSVRDGVGKQVAAAFKEARKERIASIRDDDDDEEEEQEEEELPDDDDDDDDMDSGDDV